MILSKVVNVKCTLQMPQCMTARFHSLNGYQPGEDAAAGKVDEKADDQESVWHLFSFNLFSMVLFLLLFSFLFIKKQF